MVYDWNELNDVICPFTLKVAVLQILLTNEKVYQLF